MTDLITFPISGKSMSTIQGSELYQRPHLYTNNPVEVHAALAAGVALNDATVVRRGRGVSYRVTCHRAAAEIIRDYCETVGETFAGETEPETRADGRALLATADRIAKEIAAFDAANTVIVMHLAPVTDHVTDDGTELTKQPYPFAAHANGRIVGRDGYTGAVGVVADLARQTIDVLWADVVRDPQRAVGKYLITCDTSGRFATQMPAIASVEVRKGQS